MSPLWTEQYRPTTLLEVQGQDTGIRQLVSCVKAKKPCIIHGPVGCGKTAAVYALAQEHGYELVELHSYDWKGKDEIEQVAGGVLNQQSLWGNQKILFIDDAEGFSGTADRGGLSALAQLLDAARGNHAVVFSVHDPWESGLQTIRKKCEIIPFQKVGAPAVRTILKRICERESITADQESLDYLGRRCQGDVRAAITDLQLLAAGMQKLTKQQIELLHDREKEQSIFQGLQTVFKSTDSSLLMNAFEGVDADWDELILWIDENIPLEYRGKSLAQAFECVSKADVFRGRIRKWQHWRFLVYVENLLTAGIGSAKTEPSKMYVTYRRNQRIWKQFAARQRNKQKAAIVERVMTEQGCHESPQKLMRETLPYLAPFFARLKSKEFSADEIALLRGR